ncbi:MAG: hypothetical protein ACOCP8_00700 [archaeon]
MNKILARIKKMSDNTTNSGQIKVKLNSWVNELQKSNDLINNIYDNYKENKIIFDEAVDNGTNLEYELSNINNDIKNLLNNSSNTIEKISKIIKKL